MPEKQPPRWWQPWVRDMILLAAGLAGVAHETVVEKGERPSLLLLFGAMMALPVYLRRNGASHD